MAKVAVRSKKTPVAKVPAAKAEKIVKTTPEKKEMRAVGPYSANAMMFFIMNNAGLLFMALAIFMVGFLAGSIWTENKMLKDGFVKGGSVAAAPAAQPDAAPAQPLSDADWQKIQENPSGIIGNKDAKLTMVEFTDYQCPFCGRHFTETYPQLKKQYIDTGKLKLVMQDEPLSMHPNARIGALAARCAADQGGFMGANKDKNLEAMHDALFSHQNDWAVLSKDDAIKKYGEYAKAAGMNGDQLMDCVKTEKFGKVVDDSAALGQKVGANGTPTFFIEKQPVVGAQPLSAFQAILDKAN